MVDIYSVIKRPLVSEKTAALKEEANKVAFEVAVLATKADIKAAVQAAFNVTVTGVTTMGYRGKVKRVGRNIGQRQNWKKAIVTLKAEDEIDVLGEGQK